MLTTVAKLKEALSITDESQDSILEFYIQATSASIESYCDRKFGRADYDLTIQPNNEPVILLPQYPVIEVAQIKHGDDTLTTDDYRIDVAAGMLYKTTGSWEEEVKAEFTAGYVLPGDGTEEDPRTLPYDIEFACIMWSTEKFTVGPKIGITREVVDDVEVTYESPFARSVSTGGRVFPAPPTIMALLGPYRRMGT